MRFALTIETSAGVSEHRTNLIVGISNRLSEYFRDRDYGSDVRTILIGVICVAPEFEWFSKLRRPKYVRYRKYVLDGIEIIEDRVFSFDIRIDYEQFNRQDDEDNIRMVTAKIIESLINLEDIPAASKAFDKGRFIKDVTSFLREVA